MNLHPKNVQLCQSVDMAKRPPNDSKFFLVVVLILKIANLDVAAGSDDFCLPKHALIGNSRASSQYFVIMKGLYSVIFTR